MGFSMTHIPVALVFIIITYSLLMVFVVFPTWKKYRIQKARASLAKCFRMLNQGSLPSGQISDGHYLHDNFYKVLFSVLMHDGIKMMSISNIMHTDQEEERRQAFRREVDNLDEETKSVVNGAIAAIGAIVFLQNIIMFPRAIFKTNQARYKYRQRLREQMMKSGEDITINSEINIHRGCPA